MHNILDDILDSKSKIRILRLMFKYPKREFTEREIANMINMSPNTVNLALKSLRITNIFLYKQIGNTHIYKSDQNSILFNLIKNLFEGEKQIREALFKLLKEKLPNVQSCIVFGSFAMELENFESDLDILIVSKNKEKTQDDLDKVSEEILESFGTVISSIMLTPKEFKMNKNKPYIIQALSDGILITGKKLVI